MFRAKFMVGFCICAMTFQLALSTIFAKEDHDDWVMLDENGDAFEP